MDFSTLNQGHFTLARALGHKFESDGGKADLFHLNLTRETLNLVTFADIP